MPGKKYRVSRDRPRLKPGPRNGGKPGPQMWQLLVQRRFPEAQFTEEDGSGRTYGEPGDITAHVGPDMQSDVVGTYSPGQGGWVLPPKKVSNV